MSDLEADRAEIIALIHANRVAIWMRDFDAWSACFVHEPYLTRQGWWRQGGVFSRHGWVEISSRLQREMLEVPHQNPRNAYDTKVENLMLRISGDMAWATFDHRYPGVEIAGLPGPGLSHETRVFERHGGRWKIAMIGLLDAGIGYASRADIQLDAECRVLWISSMAEAALAADDDLVIRNGRLRVRDSRTDRKLQMAVKWAAGLDDAYMPTSGAVPILMDDGDGLPTKVWWVVANAAMIHFSFGDKRATEQRLDVAAMVYGLSPAQKQVAALVVDGLALAAIAERLAITPNTARTHLNRVFDKTGVRTQPALVRALLSAVAPL